MKVGSHEIIFMKHFWSVHLGAEYLKFEDKERDARVVWNKLEILTVIPNVDFIWNSNFQFLAWSEEEMSHERFIIIWILLLKQVWFVKINELIKNIFSKNWDKKNYFQNIFLKKWINHFCCKVMEWMKRINLQAWFLISV